jgi:hypothetical protein
MKRIRKTYIRFLKSPDVERSILLQAKKEKNIIYGAQSIKKQIGIYARGTKDYDIFSKKPKRSATVTEKNLDRIYGWDNFYVKPANHPGTYKVMDKGYDCKPKTDDDFNVADYTVMPKKVKYITYNGVRYRNIQIEKQAKLKAVKDKSYAYRHEKDKEDLERIKIGGSKYV